MVSGECALSVCQIILLALSVLLVIAYVQLFVRLARGHTPF